MEAVVGQDWMLESVCVGWYSYIVEGCVLDVVVDHCECVCQTYCVAVD